MNDVIWLFRFEQGHQQIRGFNPVIDGPEMLMLQQHLLPSFLQLDVIIVGHGVQADDPEAVREKAFQSFRCQWRLQPGLTRR